MTEESRPDLQNDEYVIHTGRLKDNLDEHGLCWLGLDDDTHAVMTKEHYDFMMGMACAGFVFLLVCVGWVVWQMAGWFLT